MPPVQNNYDWIGDAIGAGAGIFGTIYNNLYGRQREAEARQQNYYYGELQAQNADARTRALYNDLYSPAAQVRQLREAGLSPSLFYGDGGGIAGQTGAQGNAAGIGTNPYYFNPMEAAQISLIQAQARKTNKEADNVDPIAKASIKQMLADAGLKEASMHAGEADAALKQLQYEIGKETKQFTIDQAKWQAKKYEYNATQALYEALNEKQDYHFNVETFQARVQEQEQSLTNLVYDTMLKHSQIELNEQQKEGIKATIAQAWQKLKIEAEKVAAMKEDIGNRKKYWEDSVKNVQKMLQQDMEKFGKSLTQGYIKMGVQAATSLLSGNMAGNLLQSLLGGSPAGENTLNSDITWE